jgi:flagellar biosynthetic protein FliO
MMLISRLPLVSVIAPVLLPLGVEVEAKSIGVDYLPVVKCGVLAAGQSLGLELWVQLIGLLLLILGLFAAFAWAVKRWKLLPQLRGGQNRLQIVEVRSLGQRNSLMVVGYGEQRFLLGASNTGLQLLSDLPMEKTDIGQVREIDSEKPGKTTVQPESDGSFLSDLNRHIGKEGE